MPVSKTLTRLFLAAALSLPLQACIHTYPESARTTSPNLHTSLALTLDVNFSPIADIDPDDADIYPSISTTPALRRFIIEAEIPGSGSPLRHTAIIRDADVKNRFTSLRLPFPLRPRLYNLRIWTDLLNPKDSLPLHYCADNTSDISAIQNNSYLIPQCASLSDKLDLRSYSEDSEAAPVENVCLSPPTALVMIKATDLDAFFRAFPDARNSVKTYTATVSFNQPFPSAFSLATGQPLHYLPNHEETFPLTFSDDASTLAIFPIFCPSEGMEFSVDISIHNKARVMVSKLSDISLRVERDRTTVVKGPFMTNFLSNPIIIDDKWADEIIIDLSSP